MPRVFNDRSFIAFIILAVFFAWLYRWQINPDSLSYYMVAQKISVGSFNDAINAYWSPLFSWLMVPFILIGFKSLFAIRATQFFILLCFYILLRMFFKKLKIERSYESILTFGFSFFLFYAAYFETTADLLHALIVSIYIFLLLDTNRFKFDQFIFGILGALMFLSKTYGFVFFIMHFTLIALLNKKINLKKYFINVLVFIIISFSWIFALKLKYSNWMLGSAGTYNYNLHAPNSKGHPIHFAGLLDLPDKNALSTWDDPTYLIPLLDPPKWKPFSNIQSRHELWMSMKANLSEFTQILLDFNVFGFSLIVFAILMLLKKNRDSKVYLIILSCFLFYPVGYLILHLFERFFWIHSVMFLFITVYFIKFIQTYLDKKTILWIVLFISFAFAFRPLNKLRENRNSGLAVFEEAMILKEKMNINAPTLAVNKNWHEGLYLAFHLKGKFLGEIDFKAPFIEEILLKKNINTFLLYHEDLDPESPLRYQFKEVSEGLIPQVKVYKKL